VEVVAATAVRIVPMNLNMKREMWFWQKSLLNLRLIILKMEQSKIHNRVLEIQSQIQNTHPEQQVAMLSELLELASKIEQSLSEIKIENNEG
jgi:hypothetical protein